MEEDLKKIEKEEKNYCFFKSGVTHNDIFFFIYHWYSSTRYWAMKYSLIKRLRAGFGIQSCSLANGIYLKYFLNISPIFRGTLVEFLISLI